MASLLFLLFQFLSFSARAQSGESETPSPPTTEFTFKGFGENNSEIQREGAAAINPDGLLRLTDENLDITGTAFYRKPVRLLDHSNNVNLSTKAKVCSFSTSFVFTIVPSSSSNRGGFGFTFTLPPTPNRPGAGSGQYLGLLNETNDGNPMNHVFAVEFDTIQGFKDGTHATGNHIGLNFNSITSDVQVPVSYTTDDEVKEEGFQLEPIVIRLDYNGQNQMLNLIVSFAKLPMDRSTPSISHIVPKLSEIVQEEMYVGFTAATGKDRSSSHYLMGWSFRSCRDGLTADRLVLQELPLWQLNMGNKNKDNQSTVRKILIAASLIVSTLVGLGVVAFFIRKRKTSNAQRRKNLKALTPLKHYHYNEVKRFTNSFACVVGKGGFGTVYKGNLPDGRSVAVKVLKDSKSNGEEDFINEVARVARGLEYLHYGCKTRIVHFDIKPQNVLLDCNLCPKVSDFGLAKLCEKKESIMSLLETRGTIGYIAPEMISRVYGGVSHKSDVYSYGMLVLEMIGATNKDTVENTTSNTSSIYFPDGIYNDLENEQQSRLYGDDLTKEEKEITKKMILVALWCIQSYPSNRPSMNRVVEMMEGRLDSLEVPPRPVLQVPIAPLQESSTLSGDVSVYIEK
ncbi:Protein kinase domain-containing protein [Hirschfeldia incana]|nr:Protein kinase domain-containing protein [Hirschfeldia incana]